MRLKLLRAAAVVAVLGGTATFGLGTQAALASPTFEPCGTDLTTVITSSTSGTFSLATGCTYWVTSQLTVMHAVTIYGNHARIVRTSDSDPFSIFVVGCANGDLTLYNVNVRNGGGDGIDGGAIHMDPGTVNIYGGTFSDNNAIEGEGGGYGGAIYNLNGTLNVSGATFTNNSATNDGGAVYSDNDDATLNHSSYIGNQAEYGGAIYNLDSDMTISQGNFRYNSASDGGAIYNDWNVTVNGTLFAMNTASGNGGAIYNDDTLHLNRSLLTVNNASNGGGGIYNDDETVYLLFDQINQNFPDNCEPVNTITGCVG